MLKLRSTESTIRIELLLLHGSTPSRFNSEFLIGIFKFVAQLFYNQGTGYVWMFKYDIALVPHSCGDFQAYPTQPQGYPSFLLYYL